MPPGRRHDFAEHVPHRAKHAVRITVNVNEARLREQTEQVPRTPGMRGRFQHERFAAMQVRGCFEHVQPGFAPFVVLMRWYLIQQCVFAEQTPTPPRHNKLVNDAMHTHIRQRHFIFLRRIQPHSDVVHGARCRQHARQQALKSGSRGVDEDGNQGLQGRNVAVTWVERQQVVQVGGATPRLPHNENRFGVNVRGKDARCVTPAFPKAQRFGQRRNGERLGDARPIPFFDGWRLLQEPHPICQTIEDEWRSHTHASTGCWI